MVSDMVVLGCDWARARRFLPYDLDGYSVDRGALCRRRGVRNGECLVRSLLLCALPKSSFELASKTARRSGLANLSAQALFYRMRDSESLMQGLFEHALGHVVSKSEYWRGFRVLAVDATTLCGPGATGTDQRLHVVYDLGKAVPVTVELTSPKGGETFRRHGSFGANDLVLADAGYGHASGIVHALSTGAKVLVRFNFESIRLLGFDKEKIWPEQAAGVLGKENPEEFEVLLHGWDSPLRVIGDRNPEGLPVWFLTNLNAKELETSKVRELYSRRWQIELFFKRLKSLMDLDTLPTRAGPSARPWIWAKLLLATLAVLLADESFFPSDNQTQSMENIHNRSLDGRRSDALSPTSKTKKRKTQRQKETKNKIAQATLLMEGLT